MPRIRTYYDTLNVARNASEAGIRSAYKALMQHYHPDKFKGTVQEGLRMSKLIRQSYAILSDPGKRARYDRWLVEQESKTEPAEQTKKTVVSGAATQNRQIPADEPRPMGGSRVAESSVWRKLKTFYNGLRGRVARHTKGRSAKSPAVKEESTYQVSTALSEAAYQYFVDREYGMVQAMAEHDPLAKLVLGAMYDNGEGVAGNSETATVWYRQAYTELLVLSVNGDAVACFYLAVMYKDGLGVPQNPQQAVHWFEQAAGQGNSKARYELGAMLLSGLGVPKDRQQGVILIQQAARQGLVEAQSRLGLFYELEKEWCKDGLQQAFYWYTLAAEQGDMFSRFALGQMYACGRGGAKNMQKATYWYGKAAEQGWPFAASALAMIYEESGVSTRDYVQAYLWWCIATALGHPRAESDRAAMAKKMTEGQLREAESLAADWVKRYRC